MKPNCRALINRKIFAIVAIMNRMIEVGLAHDSKIFLMIILPFILFSVIVAPVSGISFSYKYYDGSGSISDSQNYNLDDSTLLKSSSIFEGSNMQQSFQAGGKGHNNLQQSIKGNSYSVDNSLSSLGTFSAAGSSEATSAAASLNQGVIATGESSLLQTLSGDGITAQSLVSSSGDLSAFTAALATGDSNSLNQQLIGGGNVDLTMSGIQGSDNSGQKASVEAGSMVTAQAITVGQGVSSSQSTAISGEAGSVGSGVLSSNNMMLATGSFDGSGSLEAKLNTGAADEASVHGKVSVNGGTLIDDSTIQNVGKENTGLNIEGQTAAPDGSTGSFDANVVNMNRAEGKLAGAGGVAAAPLTGYNLWMGSGALVLCP